MKTTKQESEIQKALEFATEKHKNQFTKHNGVCMPFVMQSLSVLDILGNRWKIIDGDTVFAVSAILHAVLRKTKTRKRALTEMFGEEVKSIVESLGSPLLPSMAEEERTASELKCIQSLKSKDIRALMIRAAECAYTMSINSHEQLTQSEHSVRTIEQMSQVIVDRYQEMIDRWGVRKTMLISLHFEITTGAYMFKFDKRMDRVQDN